MPIFQERHSKRFHITLQVADLSESIHEYSEILGQQPCCIVPQRLALWRTSELNFLLRARSRQRTAVLQLGWEFDYLEDTQRFKDHNQLSWLFFSTGTQDDAINRLNIETEYDEDSDFLLELRNPNARWNLWASLVLLLGMAAFTVFNHDWLRQFFRQPGSEMVQDQQARELQDLYSANQQLQAAGRLLQQSGYMVSYLDSYAIAQHPQQASITFQIVNQQVLFSTYWSLRSKDDGQNRSAARRLFSEQEITQQINIINREAVLCRYYLDQDKDLAVEAWFALPPTLLLGPARQQNAQSVQSTAQTSDSSPDHVSLSVNLELAQQQARQLWQRTLELWQQESLNWLQSSPLFGGELEPRQSFSKK